MHTSARPFVVVAVLLIAMSAMAVPPHPRLWESSESARREYAQLPLDPIRQNAKLQPDGIEFALVLRVDFADKPGVRSRAQLDGWLFDKERSSLAAYYNEISYGKMDLQSGPGGGSYPEQNRWYRMPETMAFYGSGRIDTARYQALVRDALNIADADVNLRDFDRDGDNIVDHLIILHSGDDEAATGFTGDIWSILISEIPGEWDGVRAEAAMVIAEEPSFNAPHLGVWFHEFLHDFGAPETYMNGSFASPNDQQYCLMGLFGPYQGGGTARDGSQPAHVSGYLKWDIDGIPENGRVGWITPIELDANTIGLEIPPFSQIGNERPLYKIDIPGKGGKEFFLLENRQSDVGARYDTALPDNGLLIWHVDESVSRSLVTVAQRLWVEDPSDPKHDRLDSGLTMDAAYSDEDGQTAFSPSTSPNSNANDGMTSEISILSIARRGTNMALDVFFGDTYEPNDTLATAFPIRFDQTYDSFLFDASDLADYYALVVSANEAIRVGVTFDRAARVNVSLVDDGGSWLAAAVSQRTREGGERYELLYYSRRNETVYVKVEPVATVSAATTYALLAVRDTAVVDAPPRIASLRMFPNPVRSGDSLTVEVGFESAGIDELRAELYTIDGHRAAEASIGGLSSGAGVLAVSASNGGRQLAPGVYFVLVTARRGGQEVRRLGKIAVE